MGYSIRKSSLESRFPFHLKSINHPYLYIIQSIKIHDLFVRTVRIKIDEEHLYHSIPFNPLISVINKINKNWIDHFVKFIHWKNIPLPENMETQRLLIISPGRNWRIEEEVREAETRNRANQRIQTSWLEVSFRNMASIAWLFHVLTMDSSKQLRLAFHRYGQW